MTDEEAIKKLKEQQNEFNEHCIDYAGINEAYNMAIDDKAKALLEAMNDCAKRIYEIGYTNGLAEGYDKCKREYANTYVKVAGYKEGLNDAWECAKRITLPVEKGGLSAADLTSIFYHINVKAYDGADTILKMFTPEEAIEMIKEYDEKKAKNSRNNSFVPGDEIYKDFYGLGVVTSVHGDDLTIIWLNNGRSSVFRKNKVKKTGRYHKEISEMFNRNEKNWVEWCMDNINIAEKDKETKDE